MDCDKTNRIRYNRDFLISLKSKGRTPKDYGRIEQAFKPSPPPKLPLNFFEPYVSNQSKLSYEDLVDFLNDGLSNRRFESTDLRLALLDVTEKAEQKAVEYLRMTTLVNNLVQKILKQESEVQTEILKKVADTEKNSKLANQLSPKVKIIEYLKTGEAPKVVYDTSLDEKKPKNSEERVRLYKNRCKKLLQNESESNDFILDCILTEFSGLELNTAEFVGTFAFSLCERCIKNDIFNASLFVKRFGLLKKFMNSNEKFIEEALTAIRILGESSKSPHGFLVEVFSLLYDFEVVSKNILLKWKQKNQKHHKTMSHLSDFFFSLENSED